MQCRACGLVFLLISSARLWKSRHCSYISEVDRETSDRGKEAFETFHLVSCLVVSYFGLYNCKASLESDLHWGKDSSGSNGL